MIDKEISLDDIPIPPLIRQIAIGEQTEIHQKSVHEMVV